MSVPTPSKLDFEQIIQGSYDESNGRLRVETEIATVTVGSNQEILITDDVDSIKVGDGSGTYLKINPDGSINTGITGTISGNFTPSGLHTKGKVSTINITDTVSPLPSTPLTGRNSLSLTNLSTDTLYIGFDTSVTPDRTIGVTSGWEVGPNEGFSLDIQDNILIYGITQTGQTVLVKILELA